jgi:5-methylcytosine-specific restriction endonuclease McrA
VIAVARPWTSKTGIISACIMLLPSAVYARSRGRPEDNFAAGIICIAAIVGVSLYFLAKHLERTKHDREHKKWLSQHETNIELDRHFGIKSAPTHSDWDHCRYEAYRSAGGKCQSCGTSLHIQKTSFGIKGYFHVHHKVPRRAGGSDSLRNLEMLCPDCHRKKHGSRRSSAQNSEN